MRKILVLGAGKIGSSVAALLADSGDYQVFLADSTDGVAQRVRDSYQLEGIVALTLDAAKPEAITACVRENDLIAVISTLPYYLNTEVAHVARVHDMHYFDVTEDTAVTASVRKHAEGGSTAFVPQCGLAPGFISIAAAALIEHFETLNSVKLRVGALPQNPNNVLKYSLTWSTEGLINEYGNLCNSIVNSADTDVLPLEGLEAIQIDGTLYEAFNTSGGLGSLSQTYGNRVQNMDYKTMRYPGHCDQIRLLMNGLKLNNDRDTLKRILETALPQTLQDVVIIYTAVTGTQNGRLREENYVNKVYPQIVCGQLWSAIQVTTAAGVTSVMDLVLNDPQNYQGFVAQEQFKLDDILENRFGQYYRQGGSSEVSTHAINIGMGSKAI